MSRNEDLSDFSPRIGINKGDTGTDRCCSPTNSVSDSVDYDDIIITELCSPEAAVGDCKNTLEPHYLLSASCTEFPSSDRSDIYAQNNKFSVEATTSSVIACSPSDSVSTQPNEAEILKTSLQSFGSDGVSAITTPLHSCIDPCATTSCVEGNTAVAGRSFVSRIKSNVSQSEAEILKHTLQSYGGTTTPTSNNHIENKNSQRLTLPGVGCANRSVHSSSPNFTESENVKNTLQAYGDAGVSYPYQLPSAQKGNPTTSSSSIPPAVLFRFSAPPPSHRAFSSTAVPVAAAGMGPLTVSTPCPNTAPACDVEEARLHEEHEDTYLPVAIKAAEPEMVAIPMMKADDDDDCLGRRLLKQRIKLLWLTLLLVSSAAAISIGGYCTAQSCRGTHSTIPHRELVGILKNVERLVGSDALNNNNDGSSSSNNPYHQALDWITHDDPMALTPEDPTFVQRYLLAYVYFATSVQHDWSGGCGRPAQGESVDCQYACWDDQGIGDPQSVPYKRWLSSASECFWAGVFCDEVGQVRSMKLGTWTCDAGLKNERDPFTVVAL